jgi:MFS family permease
MATAGLRKRLIPLYTAVFFQGFVLWYATEKLFMTSIGFTADTIGVMVALYSVIILIAETPSGILADRWSRKGVLILGCIALAISGLIGGISTNVPMFLVSACFWGLFFALYSGTYDSIIYDTIVEETGSAKDFQKYLGKVNVFDGIALVLGSLLGGIVGQYIGLHETYLYTIPIALAAAVALLFFNEPKLHKLKAASPIKQHIKETLSAVFSRKALLPLLIVLITTALLSYTVLEFDQLWLIVLGTPIIAYGPINAVVLSGYSLGGAVGGRLKFENKLVLGLIMSVMLLASLGLALIHSLIIIVACITLIILCLTSITVVFTNSLHDSLSSNIRAGASSAVSSLGRIAIIPFVLLFGYLSRRYDVFHAAWLLVVLVVCTISISLSMYVKPVSED